MWIQLGLSAHMYVDAIRSLSSEIYVDAVGFSAQRST